jgi:hypothetical protein
MHCRHCAGPRWPHGRHVVAATTLRQITALSSNRWRSCAAAAVAAALLKVQHLQRPCRTVRVPSLTWQLEHIVSIVSMAALLSNAAAAGALDDEDLLFSCVCVPQRQATACDGKPRTPQAVANDCRQRPWRPGRATARCERPVGSGVSWVSCSIHHSVHLSIHTCRM